MEGLEQPALREIVFGGPTLLLNIKMSEEEDKNKLTPNKRNQVRGKYDIPSDQ